MARIRTIKPEFHSHEALSRLPADTHLLAAALLNYADDEGYFNANPELIRAVCCPLRKLDIPIKDSLQRLADIGYLQFGEGTDGRQYGRIVNFCEHQTISHPKDSRIKPLDIAWLDSSSDTGTIPEPYCQEWNREQGTGNGTGKGSGAASPPRLQGTPPANDLPPDDAASPAPPADDQPPAPAKPPLRAEDVPLPPALDDPVFHASLRDWFDQRRRKRLSLRPEYLTRTYARLLPLGPADAAACLAYTVDQDYDGIFPERFANGKRPSVNNGARRATHRCRD